MILIDARFFGELPRAIGGILALCKRKIEAGFNFYGDGHITHEGYLRRVESVVLRLCPSIVVTLASRCRPVGGLSGAKLR